MIDTATSLLWTTASAAILLFFVAGLFLLIGRHHDIRRDQNSRLLRALWESDILALLRGELSQESLRVRKNHRAAWLEFLNELSHFLVGNDLERVRRVAAPHAHLFARDLRRIDSGSRAQALQIIAAFHPEPDPILDPYLSDESELVVLSAARGIVQRFGGSGIAHLRERVNLSFNADMRQLGAIFASAGPAAAGELRRCFADVQAPLAIRTSAAEALGSLRCWESASDAEHILKHRPARELARAALRLLSRVGSSDCLWVIEAYQKHPDPAVSREAGQSLTQLDHTHSRVSDASHIWPN